MILPQDRKLAVLLVRVGAWKIVQPRDDLFRCVRLKPQWKWTWFLWHWMRKRQTHDGLHHAPMCPGNEWSGAELVILGCTCGAKRQAKGPA